MTMFRRHRPASNHRPSFKPELEVLEARDLPSVNGAGQAISNAVRDAGMIVADGASWVKDEVKLLIDEAVGKVVDNSVNIAQDQQAVAKDQQALAKDEASFGNDLSNLFQNIIHPFTDIPSNPSQAQSPTSPPPPSSPPSAPSIFGTYSATLVPNFVDGDVNPSTRQTLTLTLNADGSGSLSISPFAGTPKTVDFPAGTAQFFANGSVSVSYTSPFTAVQIGVDPASLSPNGNVLNAFEIFVDNTATNDEATFFPANLNRQG